MEGIGKGTIEPYDEGECRAYGRWIPARFGSNGCGGKRLYLKWTMLDDNPDVPPMVERLEACGARIWWIGTWIGPMKHGYPYFESKEACQKAIDTVINPYELSQRMIGTPYRDRTNPN